MQLAVGMLTAQFPSYFTFHAGNNFISLTTANHQE